MKGADPLIMAIIVIIISVGAATVISGWSSTLFSQQSAEVKNQTETRLSCQLNSFYVKNVSVYCDNSCFTGSPNRINATIKNTGSNNLEFGSMLITLNDGTAYSIYGNHTGVQKGAESQKLYNSIRVSGNVTMPIQGMDMRSAYTNHTNTIGLWHFDSGTNNNVTDVAMGRNATCQGMGTTCNLSAGKFGNAVNFNSTDGEVVNVSAYSALNFGSGDFTVELWFRPESASQSNTNQGLIAITDGTLSINVYIHNTATRGVTFETVDAENDRHSVVATSSYTAGGWNHLAAVRNGSNAMLYINGVLAENESDPNVGSLTSASSTIVIGARSALSPTRYFNGSIDEVRISNAARHFNTTITINVSHPNIKFVRLFNSTGLVSESANQNGASTYNANYQNLKTYNDFRVEVEDTSGNKIDKWYPYSEGGACVAASAVAAVRFSALNCAAVTDSYFPSDVYYENCV